ncbi:hypothetical protein [Hymenobacter wooponensis]|uniref:Uncharacterized protein n=1 Tax=Hymenobacter wooponensis TaxID=1525360 RepID=A0A4Z0MDT2_9BACT|nr:hypothetical protein [Hymenobacter wooponensis]TGD77923.1 hypothetical protein EU557_21775 [Hymenobacter wooponensis]
MKNDNTLLGLGLLLTGTALLLTSRKKGGSKGLPLGDSDKNMTGPFNPNAGDPVSIPTAKKYANKYKSKYKGNTSSNYCSIQAIEDIKAATNCYGIRVYRILNDDNTHGIVVVGVDEQGRDITTTKSNNAEDVLAVESYEKCPHNCNGAILAK